MRKYPGTITELCQGCGHSWLAEVEDLFTCSFRSLCDECSETCYIDRTFYPGGICILKTECVNGHGQVIER